MATKQTTKIRRRKAGRMIPTTDNPGAIAVTDAAGGSTIRSRFERGVRSECWKEVLDAVEQIKRRST
jgi:hypothetical protein